MSKFLATVSTVAFIAWVVTRIVLGIQFDQRAEGYLKRAADANTVALAMENLEVAVQYLEKTGRMEGYTSVLYRTPDEDVGFWYSNLTAALDELRNLDLEATPLERTNVLMKLRETILDQNEQGKTAVTMPEGISVFPNNKAFALWAVLSLGVIVLVVSADSLGKRRFDVTPIEVLIVLVIVGIIAAIAIR